MKKLADRTAHNRRQVAAEQDVEGMIPQGVQVIAHDFLPVVGVR